MRLPDNNPPQKKEKKPLTPVDITLQVLATLGLVGGVIWGGLKVIEITSFESSTEARVREVRAQNAVMRWDMEQNCNKLKDSQPEIWAKLNSCQQIEYEKNNK
ncbi:MAG: hypothetical protein ACRDBG_04530 [Waterburya sp.]